MIFRKEDIEYLNEKLSLDFSVFDSEYLATILSTYLQNSGMKNLEEFCSVMINKQDEFYDFKRFLYNNSSEFFRDLFTLYQLKKSAIPNLTLHAHKKKSKEIRVWSACCAAGQEPYSIAILLADCLSVNPDLKVRIFATDLSQDQIDLAQNAIYDLSALKNIPLGYVTKYFDQHDGLYHLCDPIKKMITFSQYDLLDPHSSAPPSSIYGDFDLIFCCNILYYYGPNQQKIILSKLKKSLLSGGYLVTSDAEQFIFQTLAGMRPFDNHSNIFLNN